MNPPPTGLSSGSFNVTLKNLSRALRAASTGSLFLGYSSSSCAYCAVHEPAYAVYDALARAHAKARARVRVRVRGRGRGRGS